MKPQSTKVYIYNLASDSELKSFFEMVDKYGPSIQDWFKLDQHFVVIRDNISIKALIIKLIILYIIHLNNFMCLLLE
jgi:hypothetical protein